MMSTQWYCAGIASQDQVPAKREGAGERTQRCRCRKIGPFPASWCRRKLQRRVSPSEEIERKEQRTNALDGGPPQSGGEVGVHPRDLLLERLDALRGLELVRGRSRRI